MHVAGLGRLAIRAEKFGPEADIPGAAVEKTLPVLQTRKKRGAIEGPIRIPLCSSLCLFNGLMLLRISSKSLKFHSVLFSIPTAPTNTSFETIADFLRAARRGMRSRFQQNGLPFLVLDTFSAPDATPCEAHHHHANYGDAELHAEPNGI